MRSDAIPKQFHLVPVFCLGMLAAQVHGQQPALLIANSGAGNITRYHGVSGAYEGVFVSAGSGGLGSGCLTAPTAITTGPDGHLYVGSGGAVDVVLRYDGQTGASMGTFVSFFARGLDEPSGLTFGPDGHLYVSSKETDEVFRYDGSTGAPIDTFVSAGSGGLNEPFGLTFGPDGNLYVCSILTETIIRYNGTTGAFIDIFVDNTVIDFFENIAVVFGPDGNLYTTSAHPGKVIRFDGTTGAAIDEFVAPGAGGLADPISIRFGPDGNLYALDFAENNVFRFDGTTGDFIDIFVPAGSGGLQCPFDFIFTTLPAPLVVPPELPADAEHLALKNRYVSIDPRANEATAVAYEVSLTSMMRCSGDDRRACVTDGDCPGVCTGDQDLQCENDTICDADGPCVPTSPCVEHTDVGNVAKYVDQPFESSCVPLDDCTGQWFANLVDTAVYRVWTEDTLHISACEIVPVALYDVRATPDGVVFSVPLTIGTINKPQVHYGDCVGPVVAGAYSPPDGFTNVTDVQAFLAAQGGAANAPHTTWVDLQSGSLPVIPQQIINVGDLQTIKAGFTGKTYVATPGHKNPGNCP